MFSWAIFPKREHIYIYIHMHIIVNGHISGGYKGKLTTLGRPLPGGRLSLKLLARNSAHSE